MLKIKYIGGMAILLLLLGAGCALSNPNSKDIGDDYNYSQNDYVPPKVEEQTNMIGEEMDEMMDYENAIMEEDAKTIKMTAKQWAFEPDTIIVQKGNGVKLEITSIDVKHGFSLPAFDVNVDLEPEKTRTVSFVADQVGTFEFSCSVLCGQGHLEMKGRLVVIE